MRRVARILTFAGVLLATIAGVTPAQAREQLTIGLTQYPATFHPSIESMLAKAYVLAMARRPLTQYDADWKLVCMLCTELPTFENGKAERVKRDDGTDGVRVTYTIRDHAFWGDGTPVTTRDVAFTLEVGRHPQSGVSNAELYRRIVGIEAVDEKTFTVEIDRVTFTYNALNDFQILPEHIERPLFEADPAQYRNRTAYDTDTTNPALYMGPYRISRVEPGALIALEPNEHWKGEQPGFRRIVVRVIENTAALEANLLSGSVDYVAGELGLTLDQALSLERRRGRDFDFVYKPGLVYEHIDTRLDHPALSDVRVRRALLHALDREAMNERLFGGRQPPAHGTVNPLDWVYDEDVPTYPHDPERAAALLDEAGWPLGDDGLRRNEDGQTLSLELMTTAGNRVRELVQQVLQAEWRKLGVDVQLRNQPARVFFGETVTRRRFTGMAMYAWVSSPENVPRTTLHSEMIPSEENGWSGQNYVGYANPEMDRLIDAVERELDRDKRKALWSDLQRLYAEELPVLPLYYRVDAYAIPKWLDGVEPTGHQGVSTYWVERWRAR